MCGWALDVNAGVSPRVCQAPHGVRREGGQAESQVQPMRPCSSKELSPESPKNSQFESEPPGCYKAAVDKEGSTTYFIS